MAWVLTLHGRHGLPTWVGELYLEYHRGTYTSQARTKQANRQVELRYREAEWLNAWSVILDLASSTRYLLINCWKLRPVWWLMTCERYLVFVASLSDIFLRVSSGLRKSLSDWRRWHNYT